MYILATYYTRGSPGGSDSKASACNAGDGFDPWVGKIPWRRKWQSIPVFLPGESHGWRSLVGYSPWGHKESDMTEQLHSLTHSTNSASQLHKLETVIKVLSLY